MVPDRLTPDQRDSIPENLQLELTGVAYVPKIFPPWESVKWTVNPDGTLSSHTKLSRRESYEYSGVAMGLRGLRRFVKTALLLQ